jgi:hypothetical protein
MLLQLSRSYAFSPRATCSARACSSAESIGLLSAKKRRHINRIQMRGLIHYARLLISNSKPKEFEVTTWTNILRASIECFFTYWRHAKWRQHRMIERNEPLKEPQNYKYQNQTAR